MPRRRQVQLKVHADGARLVSDRSDVVGEHDPDLLAGAQPNVVGRLRRHHDPLDDVGVGAELELLVERDLAADRQPVAAEPGRADGVRAGLGRAEHGVDLDPRDRAPVIERAEPVERAAGPALARQHGAVGVQEANLDAGLAAPGHVQPRRSSNRYATARLHADAVDDLDAGFERAAQPLERRHRVRRKHGRAAATQGPGGGRVRADHRDPLEGARVEREQAPSLRASTKPAAAARRSAEAISASLVGAGRSRGGPVERSHASGKPQDPQDLVVDRRGIERRRCERCQQRLAPRPGRAGHHQVERRARGRLGRAGREPVGHHQPVEAELAVEYVPQQRALGHRLAVDAVVGRHHRPDAGLADDRLERRQVQLAQRPFVDPHVERHPLGLGVVGDEVLDGRADAAVLHPADVAHPDPRGQERILAEALEVPPAVGGAVEVDGRREHDVDALAPGLGRQQAARAPRRAPRPTSPPVRSARARSPRGHARPTVRRARRRDRPRRPGDGARPPARSAATRSPRR